ncbi:MADS-box transcription factor family protein [Striga asiatica]|uniref:MADS-box transcription factor family protein n=1 Tax=Striga asiatica TaxID=4170 RepID=A0A5A7QU20_STRAF|nr:MADS-box transcription factor family protein [Striga asiatica]
MTRKKVTLAYINSDSDRKASFRKRMRGFRNKAREIGTLCDVPVCTIVYSGYERQAEVYPSWAEAQLVVARFNGLQDVDKSRKMVSQETFTQQRIARVRAQLSRAQRENKRRELEKFMYSCVEGTTRLADLDPADVDEMDIVMDKVLRDIESRKERMRSNVEKEVEKEEDFNSYILRIADSPTGLEVAPSQARIGCDMWSLAKESMLL